MGALVAAIRPALDGWASLERPILAIEPEQAFVVHLEALPSQQDVQAPVKVAWHYIAPGKPVQNAFAESFIGTALRTARPERNRLEKSSRPVQGWGAAHQGQTPVHPGSIQRGNVIGHQGGRRRDRHGDSNLQHRDAVRRSPGRRIQRLGLCEPIRCWHLRRLSFFLLKI
jgi:Integrase core domain